MAFCHFLLFCGLCEPRTATIKKFGTFYANDLIGQKYGNAYEIQGKNLKALPPQTLQEVGRSLFDALRTNLDFSLHRRYRGHQ